MPFTNHLDKALVTEVFGDTAYTVPADMYVALSTTTPVQAEGSSGAPWNFTEPGAQVQLTTALVSGTAYTTLDVSPLDAAVASGDSILLTSGSDTQTFVTSAAAAVGATSLTVTSASANFSYPVGTLVQDTTASAAYARVSVTNNTTNWVAASTQPATGYEVANGVAIDFPTATGAWGTITYFGIFDAPGGGNLLGFGQLTASQSPASGDTPSFAVQALTISNN